jgi:CRP-like cAMP-binding protein
VTSAMVLGAGTLDRPWSAPLSLLALKKLAQLGRVEAFQPGERLIVADAADTHLYLLESGEAEVTLGAEGDTRLGAGDLIGEMAFLENAPRRNTVIARRPTRARRIERLELVTAFASHPAELKALLEAIAALRETRLSDAPARHDTAAAFVAELAAQSLRHRAVRHPYLQALAEGGHPDTRWAMADFARHYYGYSSHFPRYLTTVISRLEDPAHRRGLLENLTEESGGYEADELAELARLGVERAWIDGVAHPLLFRRFCRALGVEHAGRAEADQVACWREQFLAVLAGGAPAEALGALGLGTENIVRTIYGSFVTALGRMDLDPRDTVFFPLHTAVDDHHQATLEEVSAEFACSDEGRAGLRRGMLKALSLRAAFWDWLHERALDPDRAEEAL